MTNTQNIDRVKFFAELFTKPRLASIDSGSDLLSLANKFRKIEQNYYKKNKDVLIKKKIAILGSFTTNHLSNILKLHLYCNNITGEFYLGNYDNTVQEFLNPKSKLYSFKPDISILLTKSSDIKRFPHLFSSKNDVQKWVNEQINQYQIFWDKTEEMSC